MGAVIVCAMIIMGVVAMGIMPAAFGFTKECHEHQTPRIERGEPRRDNDQQKCIGVAKAV